MEPILSKIAEYTIEPIGRLLGRQVGYVIYCKTNLQNMQAKVEELKAARQAKENEVAEAERKGKKIQPDVQLWLKKVDEITAQADELLKDESQAKLKCLHGFCPNLTVRHQLSRKSTKLVEEVVEHCAKRGLISPVSCGILRKEVWDITNRDYHAFQSRMSKVKEIMDHLKDSKTERIGVYGMGGVGKTTLVKEIYKQALEDKGLFDNVIILLDVKKDPNLEAIQKIIVDKLGMEIRENETKEGRANRLCGRIQGKKILVILDDVQEKIDLEAVGLPCLPTCKILLTCRTRQVFDEMRADKVFQLDLLDNQETWDLFAKMAGDVINQNSGIRDVAIKVAKRCGGLPLLVVTVASALKQKNKLESWRDALRRLKGFDKEESIEKAYQALEWSYDQLDDKELKPLFLLSGIIVKKNNIYVPDLLKYGISLSLFKNVNTVEEARDALDTLLEKLKDSCLLLDSDTEGFVKMHDLVSHVANRIAYRDQHVLSVEYGGELKEWPNKDFLRKCTKISLPQINVIPTLSEIPLECPELELFYLHSRDDDNSVEIPSDFFREMPKLAVLDLSRMRMPSLPLSLQSLKNLRTLCLDCCTLGDITLIGKLSNLEILSFLRSEVKELPKEIGQLTRLRLLDLTDCSQLEVIPPAVISGLVRLEDLRMRNSFNKWMVEGEGSHMASLSELKHLSELSALEIHIPNADVLPANLFSHNKLKRFNIFIGDAWVVRNSWEKLMAATTLNTLKLKLTKSIKELDEGQKLLLKRSEDLSLDETEVVIISRLNTEDFEHLKHLQLQNCIGFTDIVRRKVVFPNLSTLRVSGCDNLRFLFSFSMARSLVQLTQLKISKCELMQEIVSSTRECSEANMDNMFSKLKVLNIEKLPNLVRVVGARNYIEFLSLEELKIEDCAKLVEFIGDKVAMSSKDTRICKEIEQKVSAEEEKLDVKSVTVVQKLLFNEKVVFPNLSTLRVSGCDNLRFLFSFSMARSLVQLTQLKISKCELMQEIVSSTRECSEANMDNMLSKLKVLNIEKLPNLVRVVGTRNYIEFLSLEELKIEDCAKLVEFIGDKVAMSSKDSRSCKEIEQKVLAEEEKLDVKSVTVVQKLLFNEKVVFPNLSTLRVSECDNLRFLFSFSMARSLVQLTQMKISKCELMQEIVSSTRECSKANMDNMFSKLKVLNIEKLPNLVRVVGARNYIEFLSLEELKIEDCAKLVEFIGDKVAMSSKDSRSCKEIEQKVLAEEEKLDVKSVTVVQKLLFNEKVVFPNLSTLRVSGCDNLRFLFSFSMVRSLVQLTQLKISKCELMQEIVSSTRECSEANMDYMFSKLKVLNLEKLPNLVRFGVENYIEFSSLEELKIKDCDELVEFIGDKVAMSSKDTIICKEIEQGVLKEENNHDVKSEIVVQYFLFNEKVGFPSLEKLFIEGIRKVKAIWHVQLAQDSFRRLREIEVGRCDNLISFFLPSARGRLNASSLDHDQLKPFDCQNLDSIDIFMCESLKNIFPASMARGLQQLTRLSVNMCFGIEEIVGEEEEGILETTPPQFVFPKVTSVALKHLPQLRRFYPGLHASYWPLLKQLEMVKCDKVEIIAAEFSIFREKYEMDSQMSQQPFFIIDKDPFPNLEDLTLSVTADKIWNGLTPAELVLGKLKSITFYGNCAPFSNQALLLVLERLQNLEKIEMQWSSSSSEEIFVNRGVSSSRGKIRTVGSGSLLRVRLLKLLGMDKLMHLGNDNSQSAAGAVLFPNLEILEVKCCNGLKSVGSSSAISFRNLTTLIVTFCDGLEYLTTYSVVKSLVQLTTLTVKWCRSVLVLVRSNDQDDAVAAGNMNEIAFSRLQYLELYDLPRLQGFCSGNCTVKFPSSMTTLDVSYCPIKLKISPDGVLLTEKGEDPR